MTLPSDTPTDDGDIFVSFDRVDETKLPSPEPPRDHATEVMTSPSPEPPTEEPPAEESDLERWLAAEKAYLQAKRDRTVEPDWEFETIEYDGDTLGIQIPSQGALTAFTLGTGEFTPDLTRQSITSMFVQNHLSPRSYGHIFRRMMTPGDTFDDAKLGGLMRVLVERASEQILAERDTETQEASAKKR